MTNGTHTSHKNHSKGKPHIYLADFREWLWKGEDLDGETLDFCIKMDKARNTIEGK